MTENSLKYVPLPWKDLWLCIKYLQADVETDVSKVHIAQYFGLIVCISHVRAHTFNGSSSVYSRAVKTVPVWRSVMFSEFKLLSPVWLSCVACFDSVWVLCSGQKRTETHHALRCGVEMHLCNTPQSCQKPQEVNEAAWEKYTTSVTTWEFQPKETSGQPANCLTSKKAN